MRTVVTGRGQLVAFEYGEESLADNFARFHDKNPRVYDLLVKLARRWVSRQPGRRCGIGMLFEVARWTLSVRTEGEPLTLNNNYRAFYARLIMEQEPDLADLFETRRQRSED